MMKKLLLFSVGVAVCIQATAQDVSRLSTNLQDGQAQSTVSVVKRNPNVKSSTSAITLNPIVIGSAVNAFTQVGFNRRRVSVDQDLNAVLFNHRGDQTVGGPGTTGNSSYFDVSTDGGATWTSNVGPLLGNHPVTANGVRYPQGAIFNPTGNTTVANARLIATAPYATGANPLGGGWGGFMVGSSKMDGTAEKKYLFEDGNSYIPTSLTKGVNGTYWTMCEVDTVGAILVYKGVYNTAADSIAWSVAKNLGKESDLYDNSVDTATHWVEHLIAFDKSGMKGWIAANGEIKPGVGQSVDTAFNPVFWKTTDGGATWTGPTKVTLSSMANVMADPNLGGFKPSMGFDCGLSVDKNGNPHFFGVVAIASSTPYSLATGAPLSMYDVTLDGQGAWVANFVDTVSSFRGSSFGTLTHDNECAVSVSTDGEVMLYSWTDTKPENQTPGDPQPNDFPDLFVKGLRVADGAWGTTVNATAGSSVESVVYLPARANEALVVSNGYKLATVIAVPTGDENVQVGFTYLDGLIYEMSNFIGINNTRNNLFNVSTNYPNPFSGTTSFDMNLNSESKVVVTITNLLGQVVSEVVNTTFAAGAHTVAIDANGLNAGIYFFTVSAGGFDVTNKMIVK